MKHFAQIALTALLLASSSCDDEEDLYTSDAGELDEDAICSAYATCMHEINGTKKDEALKQCYSGTSSLEDIEDAISNNCAILKTCSAYATCMHSTCNSKKDDVITQCIKGAFDISEIEEASADKCAIIHDHPNEWCSASKR